MARPATDGHAAWRRLRIITLLVFSSLLTGWSVALAQTQATRTTDFLNTFAVNTHFSQADQYDQVADGVAALQYTGIRHVREGTMSPDRAAALVAAGAKLNLVVYPQLTPAQNVAEFRNFVTGHPGAAASIEGPNEVDLWPVSFNGLTGLDGARAYQAELYRLVKAEPLLRDLPVFNYTWGSGPPDKPGEADYANVHAYRPDGLQPHEGMSWHLNYQQAVMPGKPMVLTETGYYTLPGHNDWEGVDEPSQAKLILNTFMRADAYGVKRTFVYQLLDQYQDPTGTNREAHFGLFDVNFRAKPSAQALHYLTGLLADGGGTAASFTPGALNYSVGNLPSHGGTKLLQKADGTYYLVVWAEPDIWDEDNNQPVVAPAVAVTVSLGASFASARLFDPLAGGAATRAWNNVSSVQLNVTDHPIVLELGGGAGPVSPPLASSLVSGAVYELAPLNAPASCLTAGAGTGDGAQVSISAAGVGNLAQRWKLTQISGDVYELTPQLAGAGGQRLDVNGALNANGTKVQLWSSNSSSAQRWKVVPIDVANGVYELEPQCGAGTHQRLDVAGGATANGTPVQTYGSNSTNAQRWQLTLKAAPTGLVADGVYELAPQHAPTTRLHASGAGNGAQVTIAAADGSGAQAWQLALVGGDVYKLVTQIGGGSTRRLDVDRAQTSNGGKVQLYDNNNLDNQSWKLIPVDANNGIYELAPQHAPGQRLDVAGYGTANGTIVHTWSSTNGDNQRWKLTLKASARTANPSGAATKSAGASLLVAYPNPANDQATVEYELKRPGFIRLEIVDALGRRTELAPTSEQQAAGWHQATVRTGALPTGAYRVVLTSPDGVQSFLLLLAH